MTVKVGKGIEFAPNVRIEYERGTQTFNFIVGDQVVGSLSASSNIFAPTDEAVDATGAEVDVLDGVTAGTVTASKALVVDSNKDLAALRDVTLRYNKTATNVGTANTGVTAEEFGDGRHHISVLTISQTDALTIADNAALADGYLLYTLPAGIAVIEAAYMSVAVTAASTEAQADTPDVGLGTTIATGSVAILGGTAAFENILTGQTAADANGTATVKTAIPTAGASLVIEAGDDHTVHLNVADTWADDTGGDLSADISGTVILVWKFIV